MIKLTAENIKKALEQPYQLKKDIGLDSKIPISLEIEFTQGNYSNIFKRVNSFTFYKDIYGKKWLTKNDGHNNEVVSPIIYNQEKYWDDLDAVSSILKACHAKPSEGDSLQISFGLEVFQNRSVVLERVLKLWTLFEPEIYRFSYLQKERPRDMLYLRAVPVGNKIAPYLNEFEKDASFLENYSKLLTYLPQRKNYGFNVREDVPLEISGYRNRIEIRTCNGTINALEIQNVFQFFSHLFSACQDDQKDWHNIDTKYETREEFTLTENDKVYSPKLDYRDCDYYQLKVINHPPRLAEAFELGNFIYSDCEEYFHQAFIKQYIKSPKNIK